VVGDPKQSIYRFRRADIALYEQVRRRFDGHAFDGQAFDGQALGGQTHGGQTLNRQTGGFGQVAVLTANFRSRPPIADLVNAVFDSDQHFPAAASERQAAFAPLEPQREDAHAAEGAYVYDIPPSTGDARHGRAKEAPERRTEALALATWIATRVAAGDREPGDFLVLTRRKSTLDLYARAFEARNLPVEVSGAGVGIEQELAELKIVLRALADPDDQVRTVAALTGLFFGIDPERLLAYRTSGDGRSRSLDFRGVPVTDVSDSPFADAGEYDGAGVSVASALGTLHRWWRMARHEPADVVVAAILDEAGLLPHAAAGELGQVRAGALAFALDAVRAAGLDRDTSLVGALEALDSALAEDEVEAPLEPERSKAIRLMNLHKAKGLEGRVVVLVDPYALKKHTERLVVERHAGGPATGWLRVVEEDRFSVPHEFARPLEWEDRVEAEEAFRTAEETRLLYVASTRARDELVVTRCGDSRRADKSPWTIFHGWLDEHGRKLDLKADEPPPRDRLEVGVEEIARRTRAAEAKRVEAGSAAYGFDTVTALAHQGDEEEEEADVQDSDHRPGYALSEADSTGPGGLEWGSVVHAVLEAAAHGLDARALRSAGRTALLEHDRPVRDDEPVELDALMDLVSKVRSSELWARAMAAETHLSEQPFVLERKDGHYLEGVIDLLFKEAGEWVIVDYKTDRGDDPDYEARLRRYHEQVRLYGEAWTELTGDRVKETIVWRVR
jgi:ATP-dependent helicase/nuclease subunit A